MASHNHSKKLVIGISAVVLGLAVFAAVAIGVRTMNDQSDGDNSESNRAAGSQSPPVEVVAVRRKDLRDTIRAIGTLQAERTVHLSPEIDGMLAEVHFREGDPVENGQLLFQLDDRKILQRLRSQQSTLRAAQARLEIARSTFDRVGRLREENVASTDEFDRARTTLDAAIAEVEQYEANVAHVEEELKDTRFYAPFSGVISERLIDAGNYVQVGNRLATLYRVDPLEMSFRLAERHLGRVRIGQGVEVSVASLPGERFSGEVSFISPAVNEQTRDFLVKALIDNQDLRLKPGSFGTVIVIVAEREGLLVVPEEAIVPTRRGHSVFVVDDEGVARMTGVSLGLRSNGLIEITDGLTGDETVVVAGQLRISDGSKVNIVNRN